MALTANIFAASDEALYTEAERLLTMRKYEDAYNLLNSNLASLAGEEPFDLLLARAALETSHPADALLALERVTAQDPVSIAAHLYLGRAYFDLWQWQAARDEFESIFNHLKTVEEKKFALDYLTMIDSRLAPRKRRQYNAFAEAGLGGDDNANAAPRIQQFMHFTLSDNSRQSASTQQFARLQGALQQPIDNARSMTVFANYSQNRYPAAEFVDNSSMGTGVVLSDVRHSWGNYFTLHATRTQLGDSFNNHGESVTVMHRRAITGENSWDVSVRVGQMRYTESFALKDANQMHLGMHMQYRISNETPILLDVGLQGGREEMTKADSPFSNNFVNSNFALTARGNGSEIYLQSGFSYHDYPSKIFALTRNDQTWDLSLGMNLKLQGAWQLRPTLSAQRNVSSVDLYDYRRTIAGIAIRRDLL